MTPAAVPQDVLWGSPTDSNAVSFRGVKYQTTARSSTAERYSAGGQIDRVGQNTYTKMRVGLFPGGLQPWVGSQPWTAALPTYIENPGLQTRRGVPVLPYALTTQTSMTSDEDISGAVAANLRRHDAFTSAGSSAGPRLYSGFGKKLTRPTSTSSRVMEVAHTFTNNVTAMVAAPTNNTPGLIVATDGTTDDILYTDDPTASPVVFASWKALTSGDYIAAMTYFPTSPGKPFIKIQGVLDGVNGTFYALTNESAPVTTQPLVVAADKDVEGTIATVTGSDIFAASLIPSNTGGTTPTVTNPTNVGADDGSEATYDFGTFTGNASLMAVGFNAPTGVARSAKLTGFVITIEAAESNADDNIRIGTVQVYLNGSAHGPAFPMSNFFAEITTTPTAYTLGTSTNALGLGLTVGDLDNMILEFALNFAGSTCVFEVDYVKVTPTYRVLGGLIAYGKGGYGISRSPFNEQMDAWVAPEIDEEDGITATRVLYVGEYEWDNNGDRPVYTRSRPNTGVGLSVWHANWYLGYLAVAVAAGSGPGTTLLYISADGATRDLRMPMVHGSTRVKINTIFVQGSWLILEWLYYDSSGNVTDRQWVFWENQVYFPDTLRQSYSATGISAAPIPSGVALIDTKQNCIYSFFPNSTDTAVARQYLPGDLGQDPRHETVEVRSMRFVNGSETTALKLTLAEMDFGPEEALKSIVSVRMQGRRISADAGNFGTTAFEADITGDTSLASPAISTTFNTGLSGAAGIYKVPGVGVAYVTILLRIGCTHAAGTAKSPDCGPFLVTAVMDWPTERRFFIILTFDDESNDADNLPMLLDRMFTLQRTKPTQPLTIGEVTVATVFKGPTFIGNAAVLIPEFNSTEDPDENDYPKEGIAFEFFELLEASST